MGQKVICKKCGSKSFWKVRRNHLKCKKYRHEINKRFGGLNLSKSNWYKIIYWFVLEQSSNRIQEQTNISKYFVLKTLLVLREQMLLDIPQVFSGIVDVDETYLGGQWKNKRLSIMSSTHFLDTLSESLRINVF